MKNVARWRYELFVVDSSAPITHTHPISQATMPVPFVTTREFQVVIFFSLSRVDPMQGGLVWTLVTGSDSRRPLPRDGSLLLSDERIPLCVHRKDISLPLLYCIYAFWKQYSSFLSVMRVVLTQPFGKGRRQPWKSGRRALEFVVSLWTMRPTNRAQPWGLFGATIYRRNWTKKASLTVYGAPPYDIGRTVVRWKPPCARAEISSPQGSQISCGPQRDVGVPKSAAFSRGLRLLTPDWRYQSERPLGE